MAIEFFIYYNKNKNNIYKLYAHQTYILSSYKMNYVFFIFSKLLVENVCKSILLITKF